MSSGPRPDGARLLVPRAQRRPPLHLMPVLLLLSVAYGAIAARTSFLGMSFLAVFALSGLFFLCITFLIAGSNADRLDPFRVASLYFALAFCIGPLWVPGQGAYFYDHPRAAVLESAALYALAAYVFAAIGYHLPVFRRRPTQIGLREGALNNGLAATLGLLLFVVGVAAWLGLVGGAGGVNTLLFSSIARNAFFEGRGFLFWPMLFMLSGGAIYFAARVERSRTLRAGWPLPVAFLLLLVLQGRHRALAPLLVGLSISHYLIRPIRMPRFLGAAIPGIFLLIVVGVARSPSVRSQFIANPLAGMATIAQEIGFHLEGLLTVDVSRVPEVMVVMDKMPSRIGYDWGASLFIFLNPARRLLGFSESQVEPVGGRLYPLARPDLPIQETGFLPSIVGEMRANFPTPLAVSCFLLYGIALRLIYDALIVRRGDAGAVALYGVLGLYFVNMIEGTFGQNLFELLVVVLPVAGVRWLALRTARRPYEVTSEIAPTARA